MQKYLIILLLLLAFASCKLNEDYDSTITEHRQNIDELFANENTSPLNEKDRASFKSLDYFPIDKNFIITASLKKFDSTQYLDIKHTLNRTYQFIKWGIAYFKIKNDSCQLTIYLTAEKELKQPMLFIPFRDATNGVETYGGGRYLDIEMPKDSFLTLDFNLAYNPNCAYSDNWSCPIVPDENTLIPAIPAGVKKWNGGSH